MTKRETLHRYVDRDDVGEYVEYCLETIISSLGDNGRYILWISEAEAISWLAKHGATLADLK